MNAYRTYVTVTDPKRVVLTDLPFQSGQQIEVLLISSGSDSADGIQGLKTLLKDTQSLPQIRTMTEDEILAEVAAFRNLQ